MRSIGICFALIVSVLPSVAWGGTGDYGSCLLDGMADTGFDDAETPPAGDGFFYLVQGQNLDCGLGTAGFDSSGARRARATPCTGAVPDDRFVVSEITYQGSRLGDHTLTHASGA